MGSVDCDKLKHQHVIRKKNGSYQANCSEIHWRKSAKKATCNKGCTKKCTGIWWCDGGYKLVCNSCQASDDNAERHTVGSSHSWRKSIKFLSTANKRPFSGPYLFDLLYRFK